MTTSLIIGSGPAAAGAALALAEDPSQRIIVIDIGHQLDSGLQEVVSRMSRTTPDDWDPADKLAVQAQPVGEVEKGLPQKRSYGSDFPFRDVGQLEGVSASGHANESVVSGAYGGLSNVWGSQVMPFTPATFSKWPITFKEIEPHYASILEHVPFAAEEDALSGHFPLIGRAAPLPQLAPRSEMTLDRALKHQSSLEDLGVTVGRARLAFESGSCVRCGLCMTGCPYALIYSASQTFDQLRSSRRIDYRDRLMAVEIGQQEDVPYVVAQSIDDGQVHRFEADRVYVGCGAVGTTRLVLASLRVFNQDVEMEESAQFVLPMLSSRATPDPREQPEFTLNQFNMVISLDEEHLNVSQIHFYPFNPAILTEIPAFLQSRLGEPVTDQLLKRLTVGLGYLPSWESPKIRVRILPPKGDRLLAGIGVSGDEGQLLGNRMFRQVARKMLRAAPDLDLWPIIPMAFLSAPGKSYHYGGSLPHHVSPADGPLTTDQLGRLRSWSKIHMVDASVFPTVPATTFTLTIMANAHRIATESLVTGG